MNQGKTNNIGEGFFILLDDKEKRDLTEFLKSYDYDSDLRIGIKDFLMDSVYEADNEPGLVDIIKDNPDAVIKSFQKAGSAIKKKLFG